MSKKSKAQELRDQLTWKFPHIAREAHGQRGKAEKFCQGYKEFLDQGKTERECVAAAVIMKKVVEDYRGL